MTRQRSSTAGITSLLLMLALTDISCGAAPAAVETPPPQRTSSRGARLERVWSIDHPIRSTVLDASRVFLLTEPRTAEPTNATEAERSMPSMDLIAIDRLTGQARSRSLGPEAHILSSEPLILSVQGAGPARVTRFSPDLDPLWTNPRVSGFHARCAGGPLVLFEDGAGMRLLGLDPTTGDVQVSVAVSDDADPMPVQGPGFVVLQTSETSLRFADTESGDTRGTVTLDADPATIVVGSRALVLTDARLAAYDADANLLWSHDGSFPYDFDVPTSCHAASNTPSTTDVIVLFEERRGLVGIDIETGAERWLFEAEASPHLSASLVGADIRVHTPEGGAILDARSGEVRFECADCRILRVDGDDVLVQSMPSTDPVDIAVHGMDGELRWSRAAVLPGAPEGRPPTTSGWGVQLLPGLVAVCRPGAALTVLDRTSGEVVSTEELPLGESESPRCTLISDNGMLLAATHVGATLFRIAD